MSDQLQTIVADTPELATAAQIRARVNRIQEVMRSVFKEDTHYGRIPGTDKPTLYKAGSEVILMTFRIGVEPLVEDLSGADCARYRVACRGMLPTGETVGVGIGEASSDEEKYRWRKAVCDQEFDETPEDRRRVKWSKGRDGAYQTKQVRTNPADVANTVLKMAKKRAQIDLTLTATAASDVFTQDIEDLPEELRESATDGKPQPIKPPQAKAEDAASNADLDKELDQPAPSVTVTAYQTRSGKKGDGTPWTLHIATFSDGREASTLDHAIGEALAHAKANGAALRVELGPNQRDPKKWSILAAEVAA